MSKKSGFEVTQKENHFPKWLFPDVIGNHFEARLSPGVEQEVQSIYRKIEQVFGGFAKVVNNRTIFAIRVKGTIAQVFILNSEENGHSGQALLDDQKRGIVNGVFDPTKYNHTPPQLEVGTSRPIQTIDELVLYQGQLLTAVFAVDAGLPR